MQTVLIKNGIIIDGSGAKPFTGHLIIKGDRIGDIIRDGREPAADVVVEADGRVVAPGFIDMHSHADWLLPISDHPNLLKCFVEQGITTVIGGNCGFSAAPASPRSAGLINSSPAGPLLAEPLTCSWRGVSDFFSHLETIRPLVNLAHLAGHATLKMVAADDFRGELTPADRTRCLNLFRQSVEEGARGLSFGLGYDPGMFAPLHEIRDFCAAAAEVHVPVTVHMKALSWLSPTYPVATFQAHNLKAIDEIIGIARDTGVTLQLSHFIFVGRRSWSTAERAIAMVESARKDGVDVKVDAFPYTCGNTTINAVLPYWFLARLPGAYNQKGLIARLQVELELGFRLLGFMYSDFQVMTAGYDGGEDIEGLNIQQIARKWGLSPFHALLKLSKISNGAALMLFHTYSGEPGCEQALESVLSWNQCLFETDALVKRSGYPNPAALGTFPKILGQFVRKRKRFSLENAVHRMTAASAERFGLTDRGLLAAGKAADIVIFNPNTIDETPAHGSTPAASPRGIDAVFINGVQVVRGGRYIPETRTGRILRR